MKLWTPWKLEGEVLAEGKQDKVRPALFDQKNASTDNVSDGEQTRRHFVTPFIEHLEGVDFKKTRTVRPVKFTLPGPMTMVDTLYDDYYRSREKLAWEFAEILNQEARKIAAAGVDVIKFDEPAFNVFFDEVRDRGVKVLEHAAESLSCKTAVHICYGYGIKENTDWKKTLGSEWRQYEETFPLLQASKINQVSLECHNSKVPIGLTDLLKGKDVLVGAIDVTTNRIETPEEVAQTIRKALAFVAP